MKIGKRVYLNIILDEREASDLSVILDQLLRRSTHSLDTPNQQIFINSFKRDLDSVLDEPSDLGDYEVDND